MGAVLLAAAVATPIALGLVLAGCDAGHGTLVIGVRPGRPGLADRAPGGNHTGLEIKVAGYVARRLGYRDDQVRYVDLGGADAPAPAADLTMGALLGGDGQAASGPYLISGQDILTGAGDLSIQHVRDLARKRVCTGSPGPLVRRFGVAWQRAFLVTSTLDDCVRMLADRRVNAVTDDAVVLAGLTAAAPGRLRLVGHTFSRDKYGIALREDGGDLRERVDDALLEMFEDGSWRRAVIDNLGPLAGEHTSPPALEKFVKSRSVR